MEQEATTACRLNELAGTLTDSEDGYKQAAESAKDSRLKSLFTDYAYQRARFRAELRAAANQLGQPQLHETGSVAGALHRAWLKLRSAVSPADDQAILAECERGEDSALHHFEKAMHNGLSAVLREIVSHQYHEIKSAHDRVKNLRGLIKTT